MSQAKNIQFVQLLIMLVILLGGTNDALCLVKQHDYFYLQESVSEISGNRCEEAFTGILNRKPEDVGGIVWSLKSTNVHYLLEDYDNAAILDRRKNNYLKLDGLQNEVEESKREIYCKIELAMHMRKDASFRGAVYDKLLEEVFQKIEKTYASGLKSFKNENYPRAMFAFDLIAPYSDSQKMYRQAFTKHNENSAENIAETKPATDDQKNKITNASGPVAVAAAAMYTVTDSEDTTELTPGPITLAARIGPVTAAINARDSGY